MEFAQDPLLALIPTLDRSTREIDQIFASAGDRLGQGLTIFEGLNDRLGAMSGELVGSDMDGTRAALLAVVGDLRAFSSSLPDEAKGLQEVARHGDAASQSLDRLLDHIRLISAVARSARIEAAQVPSSQHGGSFFDEIGTLVALAKETIGTCAQDHDRLKALLASAIGSQREFAASYGAMLATLAGELERTLGQIEDRRCKSVALTADAARQSRKIADAVGGAIIALQCGDSTRQRLEHALGALRMAHEVTAGGSRAAGLSDGDRAALDAVLRRLVAVQLRATADTMARDVGEIDQALLMLSGDMAATAELGRSLYGGDAGSDSFLAVLEAEISQASALVGKCNAARAEVDGVTDALTTFVDQFRQTAVSLSETVCNIVLIGMNSGLHASRLGSEGRGLVIIAHELKSIADQIVADAARLSPIFDLMQSSTAEMTVRDSGGADRLASLDGTMRQSLAWMRDSGARLHTTLDGLAQDSTAFAAALDDARRSFAGASAAGDAIADAAGVLDDGTAGTPAMLHDADAAAIVAFLDEAVWPTYTMAAERDLHRAALDACGVSAATGSPVGPAPHDDAPAMLAWG